MGMYAHVTCWTDEHLVMIAIGLLVLLSQVAAIVFIAFACFMLPKYSVNSEHRTNVMVSVKFVYGNYRADVWYYSFLMLCRNLFTAFVPVLAPNEPSVQLAIMTQSLIFSFALHCYLWPWHTPICNAMDFVSLSSCLSLVVLAAAWLPRSDNVTFFTTVTEIVMVIAIVGGIGSAVVSFLLMTPYAKKDPNLKEIGLKIHLMGALENDDSTARMLCASSKRVAAKSEAQMVQTIKEMDSYDKRRLVFNAKFLDTEFFAEGVDAKDAPMPMKRIKSTTSIKGEANAEGLSEFRVAEGMAGEGAQPAERVVTV